MNKIMNPIIEETANDIESVNQNENSNNYLLINNNNSCFKDCKILIYDLLNFLLATFLIFILYFILILIVVKISNLI